MLRDTLNDPPKYLLTTGNPKTAKGESLGVLTAIMHFAPAFLSGRNVCPHASQGCIAACLNTAGRGGIALDADGLNAIQVARIQRTRFFQSDRAGFMVALVKDVERVERKAAREGLKLAVRLNGTSDWPWEKVPCFRNGKSFPHIFSAFPEVTFYDYTKWPLRLRRPVEGIPNYSLTYSVSEDKRSDERAVEYLAAGYGAAVVFAVRKGKPLPSGFRFYVNGKTDRLYGVIDGDATDLRFTDPRSSIVGLRAKGRGKSDKTGFVRSA